MMGRIDRCRKVSSSTSHLQTPQTGVFQEAQASLQVGAVLRLEEASRRRLTHCIWPPVLGSGKWTGKV